MVDVDMEAALSEKFDQLLPHLNERQRRLAVAAEARAIGWGGVSIASRAAGLSRPTVYKALEELDGAEVLEPDRQRVSGAGRKKATVVDPHLVGALESLIDGGSRGDPISPLRWTTKSTRHLVEELRNRGHEVSRNTVDELLHDLGYSLQANAKIIEGTQHHDRDGQFRYINNKVRAFRRSHDPVISVDTKKKELIGEYKNAGQDWKPKGQPTEVKTHDFIDRDLGKVVPYGVYDIEANHGWVEVGVDHDTATFAVGAIRSWWYGDGTLLYPKARRLLITADSGGSNSYRSRLWKVEIGALADEIGLAITVCHFPPGTSKWNRIEHRLFSQISTNWKGRPLTSHHVVVSLIGATTTREGLVVHAELDRHHYPKGVKVTDAELQALHIQRHKFHGEWNYTMKPKS
jgi:transposase